MFRLIFVIGLLFGVDAYAQSFPSRPVRVVVPWPPGGVTDVLVHVPYKGTVPAIASVLSADTALAFGTIPGVSPHARTGKLVLLGVSFPRRFAQLPEVPAVGEQVAGFDMGFYTGLFAPAKTLREVIERLHAETVKALDHPKTREVFAASAAEPGRMRPEELQAYVAKEVKDWGEVVRALNLRVD